MKRDSKGSTISVLVPTYRRVDNLRECLSALVRQSRQPDQVLVVVRDTDKETQAFLEAEEVVQQVPGLCAVPVYRSGVIAAMQAGLAASTGDIVALTDDDAKPRPDWLARILDHFSADENIGGVGGRDWLPPAVMGNDTETQVVGKVQWFGRCIGNHHRGIGPAREVDFLKGVNCSYRGDVLRRIGFDTRLRGPGAQVHWELALGLAFRREGWKLLYDPSLIVDHFPAVRHDPDQNNRLGGVFSPGAHIDAVCNQTIALWEHLSPARRPVFLLWAVLVGTRGEPGALQFLRALRRDRHARARLGATLRGLVLGIQDYRAHQRALAHQHGLPNGVRKGTM
jgi:Glycosyltransferases, probably involved in cell wall biogenesis